jgi:hypothetical protein
MNATQIGRELHVSPSTVRSFLSRLSKMDGSGESQEVTGGARLSILLHEWENIPYDMTSDEGRQVRHQFSPQAKLTSWMESV